MSTTPGDQPDSNPYEPPSSREKSQPDRRPMRLSVAVLGVFLVLLAGLTAFVVTCVPVGAASFVVAINPNQPTNPIWGVIPWVAGALAGLAVGALVSWRWFRRESRLRSAPGINSDR